MATTPSSSSAVRQDWMCQYTGRLCFNPRAISARRHGSTLLRLCTFHRALANRNQYRYQQRQRMLRRRAESDALAPPPMATYSTSYAPTAYGSDTKAFQAAALPDDQATTFDTGEDEDDEVSELIHEVDAMIHAWQEQDLAPCTITLV